MSTSTSKRRVVVTGTGMITPLAPNAPATWAAMLAGKQGFSTITAFDASKFRNAQDRKSVV